MVYTVRAYGDSRKNKHGGWYHRGDPYPHEKKCAVVDAYFERWAAIYPKTPTNIEIAIEVKVSTHFVRDVLHEFQDTGRLADPALKRAKKKKKITAKTAMLTTDKENLLLAMRVEDPAQPTAAYVQALAVFFNRTISCAYINRWWLQRFKHPANFRKASAIPIDKFTEANWFRYFEYRMIVEYIGDNLRFNFVDEKHIVNHNGVELKVRANPLTGQVDGVPVSGNFRDSRSLIACISVNPYKSRHVYYEMTTENVDADFFMTFIRSMVESGFLLPKEVLVLDNAAVHRGAAAAVLEDFLWNATINGIQLQVLVLYLPTRSPELNPIELVFHILARRIRSHHYRNIISINHGVDEMVRYVLDQLDRPLLMRCYRHCGYDS